MDEVLQPLQVSGILILKPPDIRIYAKYYADEFSKWDKQEKKSFEVEQMKKVAQGSKSNDIDPYIYRNYIVLCKRYRDVNIIVLGSEQESEIVLLTVFNVLDGVLQSLLDQRILSSTLFKNFDLVVLAIDEICDNGLIIETDVQEILSRITYKNGQQNNSAINTGDSDAIEHTLLSALSIAKGQLLRSLRS